MTVQRCVEYDLSRIDTTQEDWCEACKTFRRNLVSIAPRPIAETEAPIADMEIVESCQRWGVEVGKNTAQKPDLIVGDEAWTRIAEAKFKGVDFVETI